MFTKIPADLSGITSLKRLRALKATVEAEVEEALSADEVTRGVTKTIEEDVVPGLARIDERIEELSASEPADPTAVDGLRSQFMRTEDVRPMSDRSEDSEEDDSEDDDAEEGEPTGEEGGQEPEAGEGESGEGEGGDLSARGRAGALGTPEAAAAGSTDGEEAGRFNPSAMFDAEGEAFEGWGHLAEALAEAGSNLRSPDARKTVATIPGTFAPEQLLGSDAFENLKKLRRTGELTAALCAPALPVYDSVLECASSTNRPVFNSLATFGAADRGKVSIYPSPSMSDIAADATGIWTSADDGNVGSSKGAATITCGSPTEFQVYGVYRQLKVFNLLARTYPELVEAYLNKLGATWARTGDVQLLNAMAATATALASPSKQEYGAMRSIQSRMLEYRGLYEDLERWDTPDLFPAWAPRWLLWALKVNAVRHATDDGMSRIPTTAEIQQGLRDAGFDVTFVYDRASWMVAFAALNNAGDLGSYPTTANILVAPPGKYVKMDLGELNIGVRGQSGNTVVRDNASNAKNEFTFFFESFEGVIDTNSCPSHILTIADLKYNGAQIAAVAMQDDGTAVPAV